MRLLVKLSVKKILILKTDFKKIWQFKGGEGLTLLWLQQTANIVFHLKKKFNKKTFFFDRPFSYFLNVTVAFYYVSNVIKR